MTIASSATKTEKKFFFGDEFCGALDENHFDHLSICLAAQQKKDSPIITRMIP
jgi:hypothetical protein